MSSRLNDALTISLDAILHGPSQNNKVLSIMILM